MVHALIRELEEVRDRASEKVSDPGGAGLDAAGSACCLDETKAGWCLQMLLLQSPDCGSDVDSVENLIRRLEEAEREAGIILERSKVRVTVC